MSRHLWREVRRQLGETKAASLVAFLMLSFGAGWALLWHQILTWGQEGLRRAQNHVVVVAALRDSASGSRLVASIKAKFPSAQVRLLSSSEVAAELGTWVGSQEQGDVFPPLLEVALEGTVASELEPWLRASSEVVQVTSSTDWAATAQGLFGRILRLVGAFSGVLVIGFGALVVLTVRLLVLSHADEIAIMRLIGAYESDIRAPYVVAHALVGFLGGGGAVGLATVGQVFLRQVVGLPALSLQDIVTVIIACTAVGVVGSLIGVWSLPEEP